jgi:hypothetical protein
MSDSIPLDLGELERETCKLASALNFLAEALDAIDGELASAHGLGVILDALAERADKIYGDVARAKRTDQTPTPTTDDQATHALRAVKTGGVQ